MPDKELRPDDARRALAEIGAQRRRARDLLVPFLARIIIVWGAIYFVAYGLEVMGVKNTGLLWLLLVIAGFTASFLLGGRVADTLRSPAGRAIRNTWAYLGMLYFLLLWGFSTTMLSGGFFSFVVNLFISFALSVSGDHLGYPQVTGAGLALALLDTIGYVFLLPYYPLIFSLLGLSAAVYGFWLVKKHGL